MNFLGNYSCPHFPAFELNTERHGVRMSENTNLNDSAYRHFLRSASFYLIRFWNHTFTTSTRKGPGEGLKFLTCLWILLFLNNRHIVHFCGWRKKGVIKLVIFCGSHKCMIPNESVILDLIVSSWPFCLRNFLKHFCKKHIMCSIMTKT